MPIGSFSLVPHIANRLCTTRPSRLLDLGIGFGLYGGVVREWIDQGVQPWKSYLVGVEVFGAYGNPMWDLYDLVFVESIEDYLARPAEQFDCILLTDVIEHFTREQGVPILSTLAERLAPGGHLIVGTPGAFFEQGAVYGNEYERHRSLWSGDDFLSRGFSLMLDGTPDQFGNRMILAEYQRPVRRFARER